MPGRNWSKDELIIAFNLYCKIPFSKITFNNKSIKDLAAIIGRSPSSVALKLVNFASLDPELKKRNISGMSHASKTDAEIWNEFHDNWEELAYQSELILAKYKNEPIEQIAGISKEELPKEGKERETIIKARVNQSFFRKAVLASYDNRCCITGISLPDLLVASHIVPWANDKENRMNPCNGFCLNALHDRAFDRGLITITPDYHLKISRRLKVRADISGIFFVPYENKRIELPQRFLPKPEFMEYHNKYIFKDA